VASANSALPKAIIIMRTTAAFHSMRHLKRAVPLRFVTVVYSSEIAIVMLSCGPSAWRTNRAGPASSAYARSARNAPTARSLYAVSRRSAWAPACAVAALIAPSPHPASRRYSATIRTFLRVIGLRDATALISAWFAATSSSQSSRSGLSSSSRNACTARVCVSSMPRNVVRRGCSWVGLALYLGQGCHQVVLVVATLR